METILTFIVGSIIPLIALIWKIWVDRQDRAIIRMQVRRNQKMLFKQSMKTAEDTWLVLLVSNQGRRPCTITMAGAEPVSIKKGGGFIFPLDNSSGGVRLDENYPTHAFQCKEDSDLDLKDILCFFVVDASNKGYYLSYRRLGRFRLWCRHIKRRIYWWLTGDLKYR